MYLTLLLIYDTTLCKLAVFLGTLKAEKFGQHASLAVRKWRENEKVKRKWREDEETEGKRRENWKMERE